jgi:hypothetical protein
MGISTIHNCENVWLFPFLKNAKEKRCRQETSNKQWRGNPRDTRNRNYRTVTDQVRDHSGSATAGDTMSAEQDLIPGHL